jgi:hypothetical protein
VPGQTVHVFVLSGRVGSCRDVSSAVRGLTQATGNERPSVGLGAEEAQYKATSGVSVRRAAKQLRGGPDEYFRWARSSLAAYLSTRLKPALTLAST